MQRELHHYGPEQRVFLFSRHIIISVMITRYLQKLPFFLHPHFFTLDYRQAKEKKITI
jgi:hypothetical protein